MKKRTVAQLKKIMAAGYAARNELDERNNAKLNRQNAHLVGQAQKCRNSYGSDEKWWLYRRITSVDGQWCKAFKFEVTTRNTVDIALSDHGSVGGMMEWINITDAEFEAAWRDVVALLPATQEGQPK